jgi:hypothetical protein
MSGHAGHDGRLKEQCRPAHALAAGDDLAAAGQNVGDMLFDLFDGIFG